MATTGEAFAPPRPSFARSLQLQGRVIGALTMRELHTRYGRDNIGYAWLILEPMLLATMIALIHARGLRHALGDLDPVAMSLIGYCNFMTFRGIFNRAEGAIESNVPLMYHRNVQVLDILIARAILDAAATIVAFAILMGLALAVGVSDPPARPLLYLMGVFSMVLLSFGLSLVVCGITHERKPIGRLIHPFTYVMMPLSGAFFVMDAMPASLRAIFAWQPLAHVFELLRYGWFRSAKGDFIDPLYLGGWIAGSWLVGLLLISIVRKRIHMA